MAQQIVFANTSIKRSYARRGQLFLNFDSFWGLLLEKFTLQFGTLTSKLQGKLQ